MICASIYLEKLASNLPAPPSTRTGLMRCLPVTFLLRLRHALGNSSRRIGALSYNSYAGKTTGELLFGASDNCAAIFPLRLRHALGNSSRRIGALGYNSYAGKTTGELLFGASDN